MLCSCFESDEDHKSIKVAMAHYPTMAIFMAPNDGQDTLKRNHKKQDGIHKSILDVKETTSLQCLAVVNYFQIGETTVVLWLATTLKAPPVESRNVMWQNLGLATYLLCMLVKQHTTFTKPDGTQFASVLSLQASCQRDNPVHRVLFQAGVSVP